MYFDNGGDILYRYWINKNHIPDKKLRLDKVCGFNNSWIFTYAYDKVIYMETTGSTIRVIFDGQTRLVYSNYDLLGSYQAD